MGRLVDFVKTNLYRVDRGKFVPASLRNRVDLIFFIKGAIFYLLLTLKNYFDHI